MLDSFLETALILLLCKVIHRPNPVVPNPSPVPTLYLKSESVGGGGTSRLVECPEVRATNKVNAHLGVYDASKCPAITWGWEWVLLELTDA